MRDNDAVDLLVVNSGTDALDEVEPDLVVHVLRADRRDLLSRDLGESVDARDGRDQVGRADLARVIGIAGARIGLARDGAAGAEHEHAGQRGPGRRLLCNGRRRKPDHKGCGKADDGACGTGRSKRVQRHFYPQR
ncbi:hypothetical protein ACVILK_003581 [Bradyrhizobium embrapense]